MKVLSPAKINLFLQVTGKRADGYHELVSLMSCIDLYDELWFDFETKGVSVHCDHPEVPDNEDNIAHKAASLFYDRLKAKQSARFNSGVSDGVRILIEKHIPVAAGLGGGSSNAGRTLNQLNRYYGRPFDTQALNQMAVSIGADVPFFLKGIPAIATGVGEHLSPYHGLPTQNILIVCPNITVSTAMVYKKLNLGLTKCKKQLKNFLFDKPSFDVTQHLCNDLETVTVPIFPIISDIKNELFQSGAAAALMSGSGPALFGIYADAREARRAFDRLSRHEDRRVYVGRTLSEC
jgi:4-diphosphocytidyl-2-C-methyl-D-erythritol kinase